MQNLAISDIYVTKKRKPLQLTLMSLDTGELFFVSASKEDTVNLAYCLAAYTPLVPPAGVVIKTAARDLASLLTLKFKHPIHIQIIKKENEQ